MSVRTEHADQLELERIVLDTSGILPAMRSGTLHLQDPQTWLRLKATAEAALERLNYPRRSDQPIAPDAVEAGVAADQLVEQALALFRRAYDRKREGL